MRMTRNDVVWTVGPTAQTVSKVLDLSGPGLDQVSLQLTFTDSTTGAKTFSRLSGNSLTMTAHGQVTGSVGQLTTSGSLPTGLSTSTNYFIIVVDANTVQFATSLANAIAGTAVTLTGNGSGTQTFTPTALTFYGNLYVSNDGVNFDSFNSLVDITAAHTQCKDFSAYSGFTFRYLKVELQASAGQVNCTATIMAKGST